MKEITIIDFTRMLKRNRNMYFKHCGKRYHPVTKRVCLHDEICEYDSKLKSVTVHRPEVRTEHIDCFMGTWDWKRRNQEDHFIHLYKNKKEMEREILLEELST